MAPNGESRLDASHREKLEAAVEWIRERDPRVATHVKGLDFVASPLVGVVGSEGEGELLVNPLAVADLSVEELAGALGAALLYTGVRASLSPEERRILLRRIAALRDRVRAERSGSPDDSGSPADPGSPPGGEGGEEPV